MDDIRGRQHLYNGFGDTLARGVELVLTPALFGGIGFLLDTLMGIRPVLTIILTLLAIVGMAIRSYYGYIEDMRVQSEGKPWARHQGPEAVQ